MQQLQPCRDQDHSWWLVPVTRELSKGCASHLGDVIIIIVITFIICNGRRVGVWAGGDEILIAELYFIMAGGVTIIFCNKAQMTVNSRHEQAGKRINFSLSDKSDSPNLQGRVAPYTWRGLRVQRQGLTHHLNYPES